MRLFSARQADDEHMHLFEIAHWIALGIMPEVGYRLDRDKILDIGGAQWTSGLWLDEHQIANLLPEVSIDDYLHLREICGTQTLEELLSSDRSYMAQLWESAKLDPKFAQHLAERELIDENEIAAARQLKVFNAPLEKAIDRAKIEVLHALTDGTLKASGLFLVGSDELGYGECQDFQEIAPEDWTLTGVDFANSNLAVDGGVYLAVTVSISDCLRVFNSSRVEPRRVSGWLHGSTFILDEENGASIEPSPRRRKGRTPMGEGLAQTAVLRAMQLKRRELPNKKEAILAEAQEWYLAHFNLPLSRSTAQRYLAPLLETMPKSDEEMPKIAPEKPRIVDPSCG
ncbi:hypothetical protein [Cypionkella sp.]|uniref:hypothetical protein n=1 Tax=Cypionkella sp. TaxID=2811411 RepID=UPI00271C9D4E|nr:hypothetical protein [Cypionkella sp.]MDO8982859.1 hypothetical protein [Cypionkella sp.]MDP2049607.1 hypothetical protein [Cypionkella sp.]